MKKKVIYVVPCSESLELYDFTANRFLFKALKSCGVCGYFDMSITSIPMFSEDIDCSPISLGG